jgi:two-component system sensor histidine kinase RegB
VAAAAHELGTPLATIKLTSAELVADLADHPSLQEDARLIHDQANRCRDILRSMGSAGKDDLQMRSSPLETLLRDAAEPHVSRGKTIHFALFPSDDQPSPQPKVLRKPEVIHGLRNLIQNAVDFSDNAVWLDGEWTKDRLTVRIVDDGPGFPPQMLGRIGDPFLRWQRNDNRATRSPDYDGMGLGLFIAKTLLERTGAELFFANGSQSDRSATTSGAIVEVVWPRNKIEASEEGGLGLNQPNEEGVIVSPRLRGF